MEACLTDQAGSEAPRQRESEPPKVGAVYVFEGKPLMEPRRAGVPPPLGPCAGGRSRRRGACSASLPRPEGRSGRGVRDAALWLPDGAGGASFLRAAPLQQRPLPGEGLWTRASWTAGAEGISSSLLELPGVNPEKASGVRGGRRTRGGVARPWGACPTRPLAGTAPSPRLPGDPLLSVAILGVSRPSFFKMACGSGPTGNGQLQGAWGVPTVYSNVGTWEAKQGSRHVGLSLRVREGFYD